MSAAIAVQTHLMPVATHIDPDANLVVHTGTGTVDLDDVREAVFQRSADDDFSPGMNVLWDFREAAVGMIPINGVQDFAEAVTRHPNRQSQSIDRVAVIAPQQLTNETIHVVLERTYRIWASAGEFRVFRDKSDALGWLDTGRQG